MSRAWLVIAAAAIFPALPLLAQNPQPSDSAAAFVAPSERLILTRTLRRPLPGGKAVVTQRRYAVRFVPEGKGFRVDGSLIESTVDVPPNLAAIAEIERKRANPDLFPIHLDSAGWIVPTPPSPPTASPALRDAARLASQQLAQLPAAQRGAGQAFIDALVARGGAPSEWPRDLFHPAPGTHSETRTVALPDGEGTVTVTTKAQVSTTSGLLESFARVIVSEFAGSRRETSEEWSLAREAS